MGSGGQVGEWNPAMLLPGYFPQKLTPNEQLGKGIGGSAGGLIGSIWGPIGQMAGSMGGGQIGKNITGLIEGKDPIPLLLDQFITGPISGDTSPQALIGGLFGGLGNMIPSVIASPPGIGLVGNIVKSIFG